MPLLDLQEILGEELYPKVVEKIGTANAIAIYPSTEKYIVDDGSMVPRGRLNEETTARKNAESQLILRDSQLAELKTKVKDNKEFTEQITVLQTTNAEEKKKYENNILDLRKTIALKEALSDAGVQSSESRDLLVHKFDLKTINLSADGKVIGATDLITPIKENPAFKPLFGEIVIEGHEHNTSDKVKTNSEIKKLESELAAATEKNDTLQQIRIKRKLQEERNKL